jgi:hypothetical protein
VLSTRPSSLFLSASPTHDSKRARLVRFHRARPAARRSSSARPKTPCRGRLTSNGPRRALIPASTSPVFEPIVSTLKASQRALLNVDEQATNRASELERGPGRLAAAVWGRDKSSHGAATKTTSGAPSSPRVLRRDNVCSPLDRQPLVLSDGRQDHPESSGA